MRGLFLGINASSKTSGDTGEAFIPNAFSFSAQTDLEQEETITSLGVQITAAVSGGATPITITGGQYQIASDSEFTTIVTEWTSADGLIDENQYVRVRCATTIGWEVERTATVEIGPLGNIESSIFSVTTRSAVNVLLDTVGTGTWSPSRKWIDTNNVVETIGGGGGGACGSGATQCGSGGGGGYARKSNISYTGVPFDYNVGAGGAGGAAYTGAVTINQNGKNGDNTWFDSTSVVNASGGTGGRYINAGGSGVPGAPGTGGTMIAGDSGSSGGIGAARNLTCAAQNGGGAAGGPGGNGGNGGLAGYAGCATARYPGGGGEGGGNNGAGNNGTDGAGGGGAPGVGGSSADAGGNGATNGGAAGNGANWAVLYGSTGGSGGGGAASPGGLYGGGGSNSHNQTVAGHAGARGAIHIRY